MKILLLLIFFTSSLTFANSYYRFDPGHLHGEKAHFTNLKKVFDKGRMQIYELNPGSKLIGNQSKYLKKIQKASWKVIEPVNNTLVVSRKPEIDLLIKELNIDNVIRHLNLFTNHNSRRSGAPGNQSTTEYIKNYLNDLGFTVTKDCFSPGLCNIWGTLDGEVNEYVLIEAHLDSVGKPYAGADDNSSGVAGLLELARVLINSERQRGLIIFATNGEESGLLGAKDFVWKAKANGLLDRINYVINMDMIGYNSNGIVDIETNRQFENLALWKSALANTYTNLKPEITMPAWGSDHVPFLQQGVPSILTIEHWKTKNPCYHRECDKVDKINFDYLMEILKLNIAASFEKLN